MRTFTVTINGKRFIFQSRTLKGAEKKAKTLLGKVLKVNELK